MLYFFWFLFLFVFGGMTGVAVATQSLDVHWHDTYFVVAHFHFIMVGGTLTAFLAAAHYWFPKMFGRMYSERMGLLTSVVGVLGFILTFFPQFLLGNAGMPRRYYSYPARVSSGSTCSRRAAPTCSAGRSCSRWSTCWSRCAVARARRQPLGLAQLRVADPVDAAEAQLPRGRRPDHATAGRTTTTSPRRRPMHDGLASMTVRRSRKQRDAARLGMWAFLGERSAALRRALRPLRGYRAMYPEDFAAGGSAQRRAPRHAQYVRAPHQQLHGGARGARRPARAGDACGFPSGVEHRARHRVSHHQVHRVRAPLCRGHRALGPGDDPGARFPYFYAIYYVSTGLHAVHVTIGMAVLTWLATLAFQHRFSPARHTALELGALYWHLVDIVSIFLWPCLYLMR